MLYNAHIVQNLPNRMSNSHFVDQKDPLNMQKTI